MSYKNPISREDTNAIEKLYEKLAECERLQDTMKEVNSYYRKNGKVIGCPCLTENKRMRSMRVCAADTPCTHSLILLMR